MEVEPFGEDRADLRAGVISSIIVNTNPYRKGPAVKPSDFFRLGATEETISSKPVDKSFRDPAAWTSMLNSVKGMFTPVTNTND